MFNLGFVTALDKKAAEAKLEKEPNNTYVKLALDETKANPG
jgi:hypothetical protein